MTWLNSKQIKKQFGICNQTLYNWRKENKIIFKKINDRNFLYDIDSILNMYSNRRKKLKEIEEQLKNENYKDSN